MTAARQGSFTASAGRALAVLVAAGCTAPLVERAIDARGGPLTSVSRDVQAEVHHPKIPGTWRWRIDYRTPDLLRWTLETWGEEQSFAYDGSRLRLFLGSAPLPSDPAVAEGFKTEVRWIAATALDVLADEARVAVQELPRAALPPGAASGLRVTWRDDGATYLLYFDARDRLTGASGPIAVPLIGAGELRASFEDFRAVDGFLLPHRGRYTLDGEPLFDETILRWRPDDPSLTPDAFTRPPRPAR